MSDFGTVTERLGYVTVEADSAQLRTWARRPGAAWPCSALATLDHVSAELDRNGDLIDLREASASGWFEDVPANELTAWIDDNLAGTPYAHLARNPQ